MNVRTERWADTLKGFSGVFKTIVKTNSNLSKMRKAQVYTH